MVGSLVTRIWPSSGLRKANLILTPTCVGFIKISPRAPGGGELPLFQLYQPTLLFSPAHMAEKGRRSCVSFPSAAETVSLCLLMFGKVVAIFTLLHPWAPPCGSVRRFTVIQPDTWNVLYTMEIAMVMAGKNVLSFSDGLCLGGRFSISELHMVRHFQF